MNAYTVKTRTGKPRFRLTFEVVTEASAAHGDAARRGFLPRSGARRSWRAFFVSVCPLPSIA